MKNKISLVCISLFLSACATGANYPSPKDGEPFALVKGGVGKYYVHTYKEDGCTLSSSFVGEDGIKVHPNVPLHVNYQEKIGSDHFCYMNFSFIPKAGTEYHMQAELKRDTGKDIIFLPSFEGATCSVKVNEVDGVKILSRVPIQKDEKNHFGNYCKQ